MEIREKQLLSQMLYLHAGEWVVLIPNNTMSSVVTPLLLTTAEPDAVFARG